MPRRELIAFDNESLVVAAGSPSLAPGSAVINNSDTPDGTIFTYLGGAPPTTVVIDDIASGGGNRPNDFEDDIPDRHRVIDGGGLVNTGTRVESESRIDLQALDGDGTPTGDVISIFVFSQNGQTQNIWGFGMTEPLEAGVSYVKVGGSNNGDSQYRDFVPCFVAGTGMRAPDGPRAIETLRPGDRIWTVADPAAEIRWVGQTEVDGTGDLAPVEFAPGVLGVRRALRVSPQHRMLLRAWQAEILFGTPEVLVAAAHLAALPGVRRVSMPRVRYCHVLCDRHAIVEAEGCLSESLYPGDVALGSLDGFAQAELARLFPGLWRAQGYGAMAAPCLRRHEAEALVAGTGAV
jgi:hypothetical protein